MRNALKSEEFIFLFVAYMTDCHDAIIKTVGIFLFELCGRKPHASQKETAWPSLVNASTL